MQHKQPDTSEVGPDDTRNVCQQLMYYDVAAAMHTFRDNTK
jgi:hypothetical protein